jgi:hypothetical protein
MPALSQTQHEQSLLQLEKRDRLAELVTEHLDADIAIEEERLERKAVKLDGEKILTDTEREKNIALGYGLDKAKIDSDIAATAVQEAAVKLGIAGDNLLALEAKRGVNQQILMGQHRILELQAADLEAEVSQRSETAETLLGMLPSFDDLEMPAIEPVGGIDG